ncbi:hypothetical protein R6Q59_021024 [Mikania micrantha]
MGKLSSSSWAGFCGGDRLRKYSSDRNMVADDDLYILRTEETKIWGKTTPLLQHKELGVGSGEVDFQTKERKGINAVFFKQLQM